jgi:uncharacterized protein
MVDLGQLLIDGPSRAGTMVILAHGAGAAMDTPFMEFFARGLAEGGYRVVRFEFPYMAERRQGGRKRPPDREDALRQTWLEVLGQFSPERLVIGGKSLGGRIASLIADEIGAAGLVCLGYPFHPTGKPSQTRTKHLQTLKTPTLIVQGTRDALGKMEEVAGYPLSPAIRVHWLEDGDHSFKPRRVSGRTEAENWQEAVKAIQMFLGGLRGPA